MSVPFGLPIAVQFLPDTCFIRLNTCFLYRYISYIFQCRFSTFAAMERERGVRERGGESGVTQVAKNNSRIRTRNYSGV